MASIQHSPKRITTVLGQLPVPPGPGRQVGCDRLHDDLYVGEWAKYRQDKVPFVPHMTLGSFSEDRDPCQEALKEAERMKLEYQGVLDRLFREGR